MTEKRKSPALRFRGYTDDWEQRKLGDEATEMLAGGDIDKSRVVENGQYPIYANALTNDGIVGYYDDYYRVKAPAVTVTGRGDVGHAQARTVDFTPVVRLLAIRSEHDVYFLENAINKHGVIVESTGVPQLTVPQLGNYIISFSTTIDEEIKIGNYFHNLDHLIILHQRKCDEVKKLKKYMLQKMFPQNGQKVPEIRFEEFAEAWEQRKLGDVVEFLDTMRKPLEGAKRISGPYPYYGASGIVDYVDGYLFDEELILLSEDGANITDRNYPVCFLASGKYWVNNHAHVLRTKQENENNFICNSLERKDYTQYNTGMAMPKLNKETCKKIPISCPGFEEQKKVGDYFRSLDHLITLHQRKLEELKNVKKYMLQKMFV